MEPARHLVSHVLSAEIGKLPAPALSRAKLSVLDTLATAIGGSNDEITRAVRAFALSAGGKPESSVHVFGERLPASSAALVNATMARVLDYDETYELSPNGCHASAYVVPAALALADHDPTISGAEFLAAVTVALDVHLRLSRSVRGNAVDTGRDNGVAVFGTTAVASRLLRLDEQQTLNAFGIAYAQAAGEFQMYEETAHTVALQQGLRARSGVESARFAQAGLRGPHEVFLGKYGFYRAFEPDYDLGLLLDGLGEEYVNAEISFKPYPCCKCIHPAIGAMLALREREKFKAEDIAAIDVGTNRLAEGLVVQPRDEKWRPRNVVTARFSLPYGVAVAAAKGRVGIADYTPAALDDPIVKRLLEATSVEVDPEIESTHPLHQNAPAIVTVSLQNGGQRSFRVDHPFGHPENPANLSDGEAKLQQCAEVSARPFSEMQLTAICEIVRHLEAAPDLSALLNALVVQEAGTEQMAAEAKLSV
jgi:2-methylcitrate dehydratase PrpD